MIMTAVTSVVNAVLFASTMPCSAFPIRWLLFQNFATAAAAAAASVLNRPLVKFPVRSALLKWVLQGPSILPAVFLTSARP